MAVSSAPSPLSATTIGAFRARLHGQAPPTRPGYDEGPPRLERHDRQAPGAHRRCADADDMAAVASPGSRIWAISIRGGGHNVAASASAMG